MLVFRGVFVFTLVREFLKMIQGHLKTMIMAAEGFLSGYLKKTCLKNTYCKYLFLILPRRLEPISSILFRGFASATFREPCGAACHQVIWGKMRWDASYVVLYRSFHLELCSRVVFSRKACILSCCVLSFGIPDWIFSWSSFHITNCKWIMSISWGLPKTWEVTG